ncbi:KEOPS complex subunit Pcc1 [Halovivax cerinus]|uniref:KEOPS complex subunit Pcc1 n=1 Tax=Halovivax cerinus TaxID=1487865 RepID=A0ABD5NK01_9EURY|nr:KEOPS complex subunit Pcc1 [Halovivax cerinus]
MTRRATIRTAHADPETVAAALAPDNTDEMDTRVESVVDDGSTNDEGGAADATTAGADERVVVTTIERESTSGLQSTVDDTLVNLAVAEAVATGARSGDAARAQTERSTMNGDAPDDETSADAERTNGDAPDESASTAGSQPTDESTDDRTQTDTTDTP